MAHREITMHAGDAITLILPSGSKLNVEVTQDEADVVCDSGRVIFTESFNYGDLAGPPSQWNRILPKPE